MTTDPDPNHRRQTTLALRAGLGLVSMVAGSACTGAAFNRYLVNDDYSLLYTGYLESIGKVPGRDYVLYSDHALTHVLALTARLLPESLTGLYVCRLGLAVCAALLGLLVFRITRKLFDERSAFFAPPLFALSMVVQNRALDLRSDLLTTLLWAAALDRLTEPLDEGADLRPRTRSSIVVGLLLGLMPVNFFKAAVGVPFFFILAGLRHSSGDLPSRERLRRAAWDVSVAALASLVPVVVYAGALASAGLLPAIVDSTKVFLAGVSAAPDPSAREKSFLLLLENDAWICVAIAVGIVLRLEHVEAHCRRDNAAVFVLLALVTGSVLLNPAYYVYNFVTLVPLLAPFGGYALARLLSAVEGSRARALSPVFAVALFLVPLSERFDALCNVGFVKTNAHQVALHRYLTRHTPREAGVFDLDGIGLFRPSVVHFWLVHVVLPRYQAGEWSYADELRAQPAHLVLLSYRVPGWLTRKDRVFLSEHYQELNRDFMVPGVKRDVAGESQIEILVAGSYEVASSAPCRLDGESVASGRQIRVSAGAHVLQSEGPCRLRLFVEPSARALLQVPTTLPYLAGPDLVLR